MSIDKMIRVIRKKGGRKLNSINSYQDLCREIEVLEIRIESIEAEIKHLRKLMIQGPKDITAIDYSKESSRNIVHIPLDILIDRVEKLEGKLIIFKDILEEKIQYKEKIESLLKKFDGIQYKVMYLKLKENMSVENIAETLGYSERQIYRILKECNT